jgi:3-oxoacyl-[acyl-carrier protein] reductase
MALKRYGQGDEIAGLVSYLASPDAGFITGASLTIDGGFSA